MVRFYSFLNSPILVMSDFDPKNWCTLRLLASQQTCGSGGQEVLAVKEMPTGNLVKTHELTPHCERPLMPASAVHYVAVVQR